MSDEEKTIENLRKNKGVSFAEADIILNLIENQQKEIKDLKEKNEILTNITYLYNSYEVNNENKIIVADKEYFDSGLFVKRYISKEEIKEKLEYQYMLWNTPNRQKEYSQEVVDVLEDMLDKK